MRFLIQFLRKIYYRLPRLFQSLAVTVIAMSKVKKQSIYSKSLFIFIIFAVNVYAADPCIVDKPIEFSEARVEMTKEYIHSHYGLDAKSIVIDPKIIVLHWTAEPDFAKSYGRLKPEKLLSDRKDIARGGAVNVSAHFLVDRDGTIYRLMHDNWMGRHIIGLNYYSIGIENVGGKGDKSEDLTPAQVASNIYLVRYLKAKYPNIEILMGHHEYSRMKKSKYWLERDDSYFTKKNDPGDTFMKAVRDEVKDLKLQEPPKENR